MAELKVLQKGYFYWEEDVLHADSTVVLVTSDKKILVETGGRGSADKIITALKKEGREPKDIDLVICTHNHMDHLWNNYLFENAEIFEAGVLYRKDGTFVVVEDLNVAEGVEIVPTPGHTPEDHTILVRTTEGIYAITGDLIMSEELLKSGDTSFSHDAKLQKKNQNKILEKADFIVPGHGKMFSV